MQRPLILLALVGITIIAGVSLAGYYFGKLAEERQKPSASEVPGATASAEPSLPPSPSPSPSPSPTPSVTPAGPKTLPTAPPARPTPKPTVRGETKFPDVLPTIPPGQKDTSTSDGSVAPLRISFVSLPGQVHSGQSFVAEWRVDGPSEASGTKSTLAASYKTSSGGASSSSSSTQSFGSFTVPRTFSTRLTYGGPSGTIRLTASAEVEGTTVETSGNVELAN